MTSMLRCSIAAILGGLICAAVWAAITYFTGYEIGWIAWGIGAVVGFAVRATAGNETGAKLGAIAVAGAVLALLLGKYAAVHYLVGSQFAEARAISVSAEDMQVMIADEVVEEWEAAGREVNWPADMSVEDAESEADYPADVWVEAQSRWTALGAEEQQQRVAQRQAMFQQLAGAMQEQFIQEGFRESFSPIDLLFFGLAVYTAFKMGSGSSEDQLTQEENTDEQDTNHQHSEDAKEA